MEYLDGNLEQATLQNTNFRQVVTTTPNFQLVMMSLNPGEEIGLEIHPDTTQFFRVERGTGIAIRNSQSIPLFDGAFVVIPPNTWHNVINTGPIPMKLYTIYSPPEHSPGEIEVINLGNH